MGLILGLGRSPGGGHGNLLQYSRLENPMDRGAWRATVHGVAKSWTRPWLHNNLDNVNRLYCLDRLWGERKGMGWRLVGQPCSGVRLGWGYSTGSGGGTWVIERAMCTPFPDNPYNQPPRCSSSHGSPGHRAGSHPWLPAPSSPSPASPRPHPASQSCPAPSSPSPASPRPHPSLSELPGSPCSHNHYNTPGPSSPFTVVKLISPLPYLWLPMKLN